MTFLKKWFAIILTVLTFLVIIVLATMLFGSVCGFVVSIFDKILAVKVYKWAVKIMFIIEFILSVPLAISTIKRR